MATIAEQWTGVQAVPAAEHERLEQLVGTLYDAYLEGPFSLPPDQLRAQLREYVGGDPGLLYDLVQSMSWETVSGLGYGADVTAERQRAVKESRRLYKYSPLAWWSVQTWTNYGLGESVHIVPLDDEALPVWEEFWTAGRNATILGDDNLQELSNWTLVDGEQFLVYFSSDQDGETTVRTIASDEITAIVTDPDDASAPWFYERRWTPSGEAQETLYYPDYRAFFARSANGDYVGLDEKWAQLVKAGRVPRGANRVNEAGSKTGVCIQHITHNRKDPRSLRGWPLSSTSAPYIRAHKRFIDSRLSVALAKAMYVRRKEVAGGSRGVESVIASIRSSLYGGGHSDTNPPAAAGATEVDNRAVKTTDLPMTTGASDAKPDHEMFTWAPLLGMGLFPTTAGLDVSRWATALAMDKTQAMQWSRYRTFWSAQFRKMVWIVLSFKEMYGNASYETKAAEVSVDTLSLVDFPAVVEPLSQLVTSALTPLVEDGTIPVEAARPLLAACWRLALQALGVEGAAEMTSDEAFGITPPEEGPKETGLAGIAAVARANLKDGAIDPVDAEMWALAELLEAAAAEEEG